MAIQIKICGMRDPANIGSLLQLPIDYIGFIFYPRSKRFVERVPAIPTNLPHIKKIGVFVDATNDYISTKITEGLDGVQLHGQETPETCRFFKDQGILVIKAFGIGSSFDWERLHAYIDAVDYFLFDTKSEQHGGTGQTFDWHILAGYPFETPYFLSGGLNLENLNDTLHINDLRLAGLDLNSQFEKAPADKDINKIMQALKIIKNEHISS